VNTVNFHYDTHKIVNSFSLLVVFSILSFHVKSESRLLTFSNFHFLYYIIQTLFCLWCEIDRSINRVGKSSQHY